MAVVVHDSARLRRLLALRVEIDREIAAEQERITRGPVTVPRYSPPARPARPFQSDPRTAAPAVIRAWARSVGIALGDRGRVPTSVRDRFVAAHTSSVN